MNQAILETLKHHPELEPDAHDGSYELVRGVVSAYRGVDEELLDYHDLNAVYLMCIGTWKHGYDKKHAAIRASHLPQTRKEDLERLLDNLRRREAAGLYTHREENVSGTGNLGMFGTGFYSFEKKTDATSVRAFIKLCVDLLDMTEDEAMFQRAAPVCTKSFRGMQAAAASVVLHCLKPFTFPIINSNSGSEDIFAALGIELESRDKLASYIENCRKIKAFRDANLPFRNYRILDMAAWTLGREQSAAKRLLAQYKETLDAWLSEESYKWRAVQCFQEHWHLDAEDFAQMLKDSLAQSSTLLDHGYAYPRKMITFFAEREPETVRRMFRHLFSEADPLAQRIAAFSREADGLLARHRANDNMRHHFQNDRTLSAYLFFAFPERYYLYQFNKLRDFTAEIGYGPVFKRGDPGNIVAYMDLADQVLAEVRQDSELVREVQSRLDGTCYPDPQLHLLADDVIYFGCLLHRGTYWPDPSVYAPGITVPQWQAMLRDRTVCTEEGRAILEQMYALGGEATCTQLSARFGKTPAYYNMTLLQLARRVHAETDCPLARGVEGDQKWWPILFVGRSALPGQPGTYAWKLRDELEEALELLPQKEGNDTMSFAKNTILYGPPGTGKTYQTVNYAVAILEGKTLDAVQAEDHEEVLARYRRYQLEERIAFTTFHQSYGYEDFIEGIRPIFAEGEEEQPGDISYEITQGAFKRFCDKARPPAVDPVENPYGFSASPTIWKVSLGGTGDNPVRAYCMKNGCIRIAWDSYGENITDETVYQAGGKTVLNAFLSRMQPGDIVLSCYTAHSIDAIGVVTGEPEWHPEFDRYRRLRTVRWLVQGKNMELEQFHLEKSLTLSTVYRLNTTVERVIDVLGRNGFSGAAPARSEKGPYVFIIDEINRGNISKIFGELITLIEPTKRLGQPEELRAELPYSHEAFGIPDNVYLLGTMNTADRSIALLDTALRRRFSFVEMMPDGGILEGIEVEGISVRELLTTLNRRIEVLFDREHTLGHAYFTPLRRSPTLQTLGGIFQNKVIPLLQEYFYDDYEKICLVLGDRKRPEHQRFFQVDAVDPQELFGVEPEFEVSPAYRLNPAAFFDAEVYRNL